jgi:hypothetical protein
VEVVLYFLAKYPSSISQITHKRIKLNPKKYSHRIINKNEIVHNIMARKEHIFAIVRFFLSKKVIQFIFSEISI